MTTSLFKTVLGVVASSLLLFGCGSGSQIAAAPGAPSHNSGKTVFDLGEVIQPEQVTNFNPFLVTGNWPTLFGYIYDPLFYFNPVKGELVPDLATGLGTWSADGQSYTVKLNPKAKWQDGQPFTADDVVYSFTTLQEHKVLDTYQVWGPGRLKEVSADGSDVVFKLNSKFPSLPYYLSTIQIVPKHIFAKENPETFQNKTPIGTGPFKFTGINDSAITLSKNSDYFGGSPTIDQLVIHRYNNSSTVTLELQKGTIQATNGTIAMPSVPKLLEDPAIKLQLYPGLSVFSVVMNNEKPGLKDLDVRKAIQLAIDRKSLIDKGEMNAVFPANPGFLPKVFGAMADKSLFDDSEYSYNLDQANQLLQKAGYQKDGNGIYTKNGKELSFVYYMQANAPAQNKEGTLITDWLKQAGIGTTIKLATGPELTKIARSGDYDLIQLGLNFPPDPQAALEIFHSKMTAPSGENTPGLNYMRFRDPDVDKWLDEASSADDTKRQELYTQIQKRIADLAPIAVMYNAGGHVPYRVDKFTNYNTDYPVVSSKSLIQLKKK